jgi:hypothetical protein
VAWALLVALPLSLLVGELVLVIGRASDQRTAAAFEKAHPSVFEGLPLREAADQSLWLVRWQKYRPGARLELDVGGQTVRVAINGRGFRTRDFDVPKPPRTIRVVCIGGSTTVQGSTNDETYPAILEELLKPSVASPVEVLNLGVSGAYSDHWLQEKDELFSFEPDVVVQYEGVNDIMWRALPRFAQTHPWRRRMSMSLLLPWLLPLNPRELDPELGRIVSNQTRLAELCAKRGIVHLSGAFAAPDYGEASPEMRAYLDVDVSRWSGDRGALRLWWFSDYARIVDRYNALLAERVGSGGPVRVDRDLEDPALFVDLCHGTREGIARMAAAFLPRVREAVRGVASRRGGDPQGS